MVNSGFGTYGLSPSAFRYLTRLEEAVFLAIRDGKIEFSQYLNFVYDFLEVEETNRIEAKKGRMDKRSAALMIEVEDAIGAYLQFYPKDIYPYLKQFRRFLEDFNIKVK